MSNKKPYCVGENYIEYIPEELPPMYMFLPVSVYAIDHFTTETLWGSLPRSFNDPFDSFPACDNEKMGQKQKLCQLLMLPQSLLIIYFNESDFTPKVISVSTRCISIHVGNL